MLFHPDEDATETQNHLYHYTVALFLFRERTVSLENYLGMFSSVAVHIKDKYFFLTAGHCIEDYVRPDGSTYPLFALISRNNSPASSTAGLFECIAAKQNKVVNREKGMDIGYIEVPSVVASAIQRQSKLFLPETRIEVMTSAGYRIEHRPIMLYGYPESKIVVDGLTRTVNPISVFYKNPEPKEYKASEYTVAPAAGVEVIDFAVSDDANIYTGIAGSEPLVTLANIPDLKGASGCGWWYLPNDFSGQWNASNLRLIALHFGRLKPNGFPRTVHRAIMVGHHLQLIAHDYPDLAEHIFSRWTAVKPQNTH